MNEIEIKPIKVGDKKSEREAKRIEKLIDKSEHLKDDQSYFNLIEEKYPEKGSKKD